MTQNQPSTVPPFPGAQPPPAPPAAPRKDRNPLAIVALVLSIVGFIFAVMEGAYLLGWILLPLAFILSLAALFKKGGRMAIAALVITIVGTVAGAIAFTSSVARIADEAFNGTAPSVVPAAPASGAASAPAQENAAPAIAQAGTRENPHPLGTTVSNDDWSVTVNSWTPAATKAVLAENQFNEKPAAGQEYALVNYTVTRLGEEAASPMFDVRVDYVSASGNVFETFAVAPDAIEEQELFKGAKTTGNKAIIVPSGDDGRIRVSIGLLGGEDVFFALN